MPRRYGGVATPAQSRPAPRPRWRSRGRPAQPAVIVASGSRGRSGRSRAAPPRSRSAAKRGQLARVHAGDADQLAAVAGSRGAAAHAPRVERGRRNPQLIGELLSGATEAIDQGADWIGPFHRITRTWWKPAARGARGARLRYQVHIDASSVPQGWRPCCPAFSGSFFLTRSACWGFWSQPGSVSRCVSICFRHSDAGGNTAGP